MILNFENIKRNIEIENILSKFPSCYFLLVDRDTDYKPLLRNVLEIWKKDKTKEFIVIESLEEYIHNSPSSNLKKIKKFVQLTGEKGYKINFVRIAELLENKDTLINKKIEQIQKYKKTHFSSHNKKYYYISQKDIESGLDKIINSDIKGKVFNFSLNKIDEEKILVTLEEFTKFKKEIVKTNEAKTKQFIPKFSSLNLINFKPEITIRNYVKSQFNGVDQSTKRKIKLEYFFKWNKNYVTWFLVLAFTLGIFTLADFITDNYFLYNSIKSHNTEKILYYSNKLRNKSLPTKYGYNYTNFYNSAYYATNALELLKNKDLTLDNKQTVYESMAKAVEFAKNIDEDNFLTSPEKQFYDKYKPLIEELTYNKNYLSLIDAFEISKKDLNLVVLIQNSNELRTSGGFVGSFALMQTKDLKINNIKFDDIYNIDGTLSEKHSDILLKTPEVFKKFLNTDLLFSRDLNILFEDNVKNTAYINYFEQALNTNVDGIVYIDLGMIKNILKVTGPVTLAGYNETVTSENFDTLAQTYSEKNYYEGSSQKENFLSLLGSKVIEKMRSKEMESPDTLTQVLKSINNKNIQIYLKNNLDQKTILNSNLYKDLKSNENKELLYLVENNLGENKVNKVTEKNVNYHINYDVRRGVKTTDIEVKIKNNSKDTTFPYGDYRGLLSFITPANLLITQSAAIDNNKEVDISSTRTVTNIGNLAVISLPFAVKPNEETTLRLSFEEQEPNYDKVDHFLYVVKQPGSKDYQLNFSYNIPDKKTFEKTIKITRDVVIPTK